MKRIVTIQDISCVGKCSLTVALPVISACGVEASVIPTAVLSTHTAFNNFSFCDLTDEIEPVTEIWKKEKISFDAIYTGYLGSFRQIELMEKLFDDFRTEENIIFIDPVMGDHGKLYPGFSQEFADRMARLCSKADVIVPNLTEAAFMLREEYKEYGYTEEYVRDILKKLAALGCKNAVLTGVSFDEGKVGVMAYNKENDRFSAYYTEKINASFHGTGDVFSSACVGALMRGLSLEGALKTAANYTVESIKASMRDKDNNWYGVNFEEAIPYLLKELNSNR
ncbi:MAG: pyridoxamine kinase [Ruminococcaceae bacterium]|nr:pyridoxamine kinase [Oscillospiraceae bacterium]MBR3597482.1 pyridoxamine kinase [Clostridia bacterium]